MSEDEDRLLLVTTVFTGEVPPRRLTRAEKTTAVREAMNFFECSRRGLHDQIEPSNTDASDLARLIHEAGDGIAVVRMMLISDAETGLATIDTTDIAGTRIVVDLYGIERLQRMLGAGQTRDDIVVDFVSETGIGLPCLVATTPGSPYQAFFAALPGATLASIYEKYGSRLLELNVRAFLGLRGRTSVNAGMRRTIIDEPDNFLAYNNGIVATVDSIELDRSETGPTHIVRLKGLQIVNGGQTTASLHRSRRADRSSLEGIMVPAKFIMVAAGDELNAMVSAISRSANSQNTVQPADFSSNDPFHITVEELANNTWLPDGSGRWFYERARGSYAAAELKVSFSAAQKKRFQLETPKDRRFSKTDLAKYLNAWNGHPDSVSFGNQKNFARFMQDLRSSGQHTEPDQQWFRHFIAKAILFRAIQVMVKRAGFPAYQANITAYAFSLCAHRLADRLDLDAIWNMQDISPAMAAMLAKWLPLIDTALRRGAGSRMPSEWAKKPECWTAVADIELPPAGNVPELSGKTKKRGAR